MVNISSRNEIRVRSPTKSKLNISRVKKYGHEEEDKKAKKKKVRAHRWPVNPGHLVNQRR
jgi:hypothetical protein